MKSNNVSENTSKKSKMLPDDTDAIQKTISAEGLLKNVPDVATVKNEVAERFGGEVCNINVSDLHDFPNHPYHIQEDQSFEALKSSIRLNGILTPLLVRPMHDNIGFEIISGHRRKTASLALGLTKIPALVCKLDDNSAIVAMVDSNQQRDNLLPSEKAWAYKMKLDALKKQGKRSDLTSCQVGTKSRSDSEIAQGYTDSARSIHRYICLTNLTPEIMQLVDKHKIALNTGVELSYLPKNEQMLLYNSTLKSGRIPSMAQAACLKEISQSTGLTKDDISSVIINDKKKQRPQTNLLSRLYTFFPDTYTDKDILEKLIEMLEGQQAKQKTPETADDPGK